MRARDVLLRRSLPAYGLAIAATAVAFALRQAIEQFAGTLPPYVIFYPAVLLAALFGGLGPGLLATGLSALLTAYAVLPFEYELRAVHPYANDVAGLALFCSMGLLVSIVAELYGRARRRAAMAEKELGIQEGLARAAAQAERQRQLLAVTLASIGDGVIVTDVQGRVTFLNAEAARLTGWASEEAAGQPLRAVFPIINEDTRQPVEDPAERVLRLGSLVRLADHSLLLARDGREIPIDDSSAPVRRADGSLQGVVLVFRDFTERRRAAEELRASRHMLREVLDTVPARVFWKDLDSVYLGCNQHFAEDAGLASPDQIIGQTDHALGWREQADMYRADDQQVMRTGQAKLNYEEPGTAPDGRRLWLRTSKVPLRDADGKVFGVLGTYEDITARKQAEQALAASEQRLRLAVQCGQIGVREIDLATGAARLDQITENILGIQPSQRLTVDRYVSEFVHPEDAARLYPQFLSWLESQDDHWSAEYRIRRPDGEERWLHDDLLAIREETGRALRAVGATTDITGRKYAEQALRESQQMLRLVLDTVPVRVFWKDVDSFYLGCNQHFARDAGLESPDQLIGRDDYAMGWREQAEQYRADDRQVMRTGQAKVDYEEPQTAPDGRRLWLRTSKIPLRAADGTIFGVLGTYEDITERRRAEAALRESEERCKALANATFEGIAIEERGRFVDGNEQLFDMLGYSRGELIGTEVAGLASEEDRERVRAAVCAARETLIEHKLVRKDGSRITVEVRVTPIRYQNRVVRFAAIRDITERKQSEEALAAAKRSAERAKAIAENASRAKDQFLAVLSHELRTPLTPVLATISMLLNNGLSGDVRESLEIVLRNIELEARLIDDLLDVTRIARGKLGLHRQPVQLGEVIRRAVEVCMPDIEARRLEFGLDLGDAGPCVVEADAARLQQVFWNLLKNAIKFTPQGGCVGIRCRRAARQLIAQVSDSGIGIEPDMLPRLFNAFEQAERSITRQFGGLGLGLAISHGLVEMHGGTIAASSPGRGRGATFTVTLPIHTGPTATGRVSRPARRHAKKARALRILLVEDHGDTAHVISRLLRAVGHHVATAGAVATALQEAEDRDFDLLISDLGLPDGSGLDLMRELRARGKTIPAIAMTGYGQEEDMRRTREAGFRAHLTKPIDVTQLQRAVDEAAVPRS
jgi:PAS domain S-box-containing protein